MSEKPKETENTEVKSETGEIILTAAPAEKRNRIRDIGLYLAVAAIFVALFAGWVDMANSKKAIAEFRVEVDTLRKGHGETSRDDLLKESIVTRKMVFSAWETNKTWNKATDARVQELVTETDKLIKEVRALRAMVTKLEKTISTKEGNGDVQPDYDHHQEPVGSGILDPRCRHRR